MTTTNKNFRVKNGLQVDPLTTPGYLVNDASGNVSSIPSVLNLGTYIKNNTGSTITKGKAVYISGATGANALISLASASSESTSSKTLGLLAQTLATGDSGYVITNGTITGLDTSAFSEGDALWLSTTAGEITTTKAVAPNHLVYIGVVTRAHAIVGEILVKVQNGYELDELHNVKITSVSDGEVLKYNNSLGVWENAAVGGTGTVTSVALSTPTGLSVSGSPVTSSGTISISFASGYSIPLTSDTSKGVSAYNWGDHAVAGYVNTAGTYSNPSWLTGLSWSKISTTPTTLSGYGITDAQPLDADLTSIAGLSGTSGLLKKTAANTWTLDTNNYLTSYTETDPVYTASSWYSTTNNSSNWNTAYGWGNHASAGYLTTSSAASTYQPIGSYLTSESDTLSSVTSRGATTSTAISITDTTDSSSTSTGALKISGGIGIVKNAYVGGDLNVAGNLVISGTTTTVNTSNLSISDSLVYLSDSQFDTDIVDIGIYGAYGDANPGHFHTGLIRDASDGIWKLISGGSEPSSNIVDFSSVTYDTLKIGTLQGNVVGNVTGDVSGNAGTVTNGVYTTGSYSDPSWISISKTKVGLGNVENTALSTWTGSSNLTTAGALVATSLAISGGTSSQFLLANGTTTTTPYTLPPASTSTLGGVKVDGTTITINGSGVISSSATSGATTTVSDTAPSSPASNDIWVDTTTMKSYIYYDSFWVERQATDIVPPTTPSYGIIYGTIYCGTSDSSTMVDISAIVGPTINTLYCGTAVAF